MNTTSSSSTTVPATTTAPEEIKSPEAPITATSESGLTPLPSVKELFVQSWEKLKAGALTAVLLTLLCLLGYILVAIVTGSIFIGLTTSIMPFSEMVEVVQQNNFETLVTQLGPQLGVYAIITFVLFIILASIIGGIYTIGLLYTFAWAQNKPSLSEIISTAFSKLGWYILLSIIVSFLAFGAVWALFLPVVLMAIFFGFSMYELLLENKGPFDALKGSVAIVSANFGPLVGRWLLFILAYLIISIGLPAIFGAMGDTISSIYSLVNFFISQALTWYSIAFGVTLYAHAKAATPENKTSNSFYWVLISISLVGWVLAVILGSILIATVGPKIGEYIKNAGNTELSQDLKPSVANIPMTPVNTSCDLSLGIPKTTSDETPPRYWIYEERVVGATGFRGLAPQAQVAKGVQAGFMAFKTNNERLAGANEEADYKVGFPGIQIYCIDNTAKLDLDGFIKQAQASEDYDVTLHEDKKKFGDLTMQAITVAGLTNGNFYSENLYIGVTPEDDSKLVIVLPIGPYTTDEDREEIFENMYSIHRSIKTNLSPIAPAGAGTLSPTE